MEIGGEIPAVSGILLPAELNVLYCRHFCKILSDEEEKQACNWEQ